MTLTPGTLPGGARTSHRRHDDLEFRHATAEDREAIYRSRHAVYATELGQHPENDEGRLSDSLDRVNAYIVAARGSRIAGFVSITPPWAGSYSVEKYVDRSECAFPFDEGLFEVRLLTVDPAFRTTPLALLLMHAALRWIEFRGGRLIVAIGRRDLMRSYARYELQPAGRSIRSGAVEFELMTGRVDAISRSVRERIGPRLARRWSGVRWSLDAPRSASEPCFHGGRSLEAVGTRFDRMDRRGSVIAADVLDAWFPPAPGVVALLGLDAAWLARTSPFARAGGLMAAIAASRGIPEDCLVVGAGSSDLIYRALTQWVGPRSRVLMPDPTYGEYAHLLGNVIGCDVERLPCERSVGYRLDPARLRERLGAGADLVVLVNPNNPSGQFLPPATLRELIETSPNTRFWIDEAYVDYIGPSASMERFVPALPNLVVCKSLSKACALSGLRVAYLAAHPPVAADLRHRTPPWIVSTVGQACAIRALEDPAYYAERYRDTATLRFNLARELATATGLEVLEGAANFVLLHTGALTASEVTERCATDGVYVRDLTSLSDLFLGRCVRVAVPAPERRERLIAALGRACGSAPNRTGTGRLSRRPGPS